MPPLRLSASAPSQREMEVAVAHASSSSLSNYPGSTSHGISSMPRGLWFVNRRSSPIGRGQKAYRRAVRALLHSECLELDWLTSRREGNTLVICSRQMGVIWLTLANRVLRREASPCSCSIAWGTTRRHVLAGEERLRVGWDAETDTVVFEVLSFSRPRHVLGWIGYPYVVAQQMRFAKDATAKMVQLAGEDGVGTASELDDPFATLDLDVHRTTLEDSSGEPQQPKAAPTQGQPLAKPRWR
jgi:uncharacterized protein (UPF0548 family)